MWTFLSPYTVFPSHPAVPQVPFCLASPTSRILLSRLEIWNDRGGGETEPQLREVTLRYEPEVKTRAGPVPLRSRRFRWFRWFILQ